MIHFLSVILGVISWCIPLRVIFLKNHVGYFYTIPSFATCAFSLQLQLFKIMSTMSQSMTQSMWDMGESIDQVTLYCGIMIVGNFLLIAVSILVKNLRQKKQSVSPQPLTIKEVGKEGQKSPVQPVSVSSAKKNKKKRSKKK